MACAPCERGRGAGACFRLVSRAMTGRRVLFISLLALAATSAVAVCELARPEAYVRLCNLYRDAINRVGRHTPVNNNLVFLAIDAASVNLDENDIDELFALGHDNSNEAHALRLMSHRFPWSREVYALVLQRLVDAGAKVVAFDLTFPGPSDADPVFRMALDRYADHVVIGSNFVDGTLTRPSDSLIEQTLPIDGRIGFTNFWADDDEVVRRARYHVTFEQVRNTSPKPGSEVFSSMVAVSLRKAGFGNTVPADTADHAIRFTGPPRTGFPSRSLFEIFVPAYWERNYQSGEFFRGKIVIVGAEGNWQHDEHPTPLGNMPGAELHLNAMNAAIHGEFLRELPAVFRVACCMAAALIAIFLSLLLRMPWIRFVAILALSALAIWLGYFSFNRFSVYLPMIGPITAMNTAMLLGLVYDFTSEHLEKGRLRRTLERYVSRDVVHTLLDQPQEYGDTLGGVVRPAAILFSDIRAYSAVTRQSRPQVLVTQLNEYFTAMVECVFQYGGTLDKFIGDALMAVWGTLHSRGAQQDAICAVHAALLMKQKLASLNARWRELGWPELRVGTGVNYGEVVVGNIGSPQRMEFTVIGDAVNLSWELQELTKEYHTDIILSSSVALLVADHFPLTPLTTVATDPMRAGFQVYALEGEITEPRVQSNAAAPLEPFTPVPPHSLAPR